ncbi:hypothetical protein NVP1049O_28 [Vibrio phage 1.049.O._10N.286.54.B5]|nr:hypothetical protein NVP1049O_28 [Vibrio phage 1.049.O._10N.286.54.B5]AUR84197.1 hypothetical protein NVP1050O_28 [Vibrio phage 1.050.O._10N.286.48.A6]
MLERVIKYGLKVARFGFTDIIDAAREGREVVIVEIGNDRKSKHGYIVRKMTPDELAAVPAKPIKPKTSLPKPGDSSIPLPGQIPLP